MKVIEAFVLTIYFLSKAASYKLDLKKEPMAWEPIAPILSGHAITKGGLVGYKEHLFLVSCDLCSSNGLISFFELKCQNTNLLNTHTFVPGFQKYVINYNAWLSLDSSLALGVQSW